ncbi:MAG: type II secretion system secretin GspD [Geminicoccaceae bacterium]
MNKRHFRRARRNRALGVTALAGTLVLAACEQYVPRSTAVEDTLNAVTFDPPSARTPTPVAPPVDRNATPLARDGARLYPGRNSGSARAASQPAGSPVSGVQINFDGADIAEVVKVILGDILGATYTMDPAISGEVMLSSSAPLDEPALVSMLEMVLRMNGATISRTGDNSYVIGIQNNLVGAVETSWLGGSAPPRVSPGNAVTIVPLHYVGATSAAQFIQPLLSRPENLRIDDTRNLLLFSGSATERQMVLDTLAEIDVDWMAGRSVGIFPLKVASPDAVIPELEALVQPLSGVRSNDQTIRFLEMARLNAVMAIANRPEQITEIEHWVERLDRGNVTGIQFFVYQLQHVPAEDVAAILTSTFGNGGETGDGEALVVLGRQDAQPAATGDFIDPDTGLDTPAAEPAAGEAAGGRTRGNPLTGVRIVPNPLNNTLLIRATPEAYRMIESTLRRLDTPPLQVLIEATIAEVTLNDTLRYGVQYFLDTGAIKAGFNTTTPSTGVIDPGLLNPLARLPGFNFVATPGSSNITIDALARITDVKVLSSPSVVVQDNSEAVLNVGDEVPITTRSAVSVDDPSAPVVNNIEYRDTGVILEVKPRISSNEIVALDISQEVSRVASESTSSDSLTPVISQRKITSHVNVQSGQTVVLGGLIQDADTRSTDKIPLLGDLPVLGNLFASNARQSARTELIVFITPRIVRNPVDARDVSNELRSKMRSIRPTMQGPLIDHESGDVLEPARGPATSAVPARPGFTLARDALPLHRPAASTDRVRASDRPGEPASALPSPQRVATVPAPPAHPSLPDTAGLPVTARTARDVALPLETGATARMAATRDAEEPVLAREAPVAQGFTGNGLPMPARLASSAPSVTIQPLPAFAAVRVMAERRPQAFRSSRHAVTIGNERRTATTHNERRNATSRSHDDPMISTREAVEERLAKIFGVLEAIGPFSIRQRPAVPRTRVLVEKLLGKPVFRTADTATVPQAPRERLMAVESLPSPDILHGVEPAAGRHDRDTGPAKPENGMSEQAPAPRHTQTDESGDGDPMLDRIRPVRACEIYFSKDPSRDAAIHELMQKLCNRVS